MPIILAVWRLRVVSRLQGALQTTCEAAENELAVRLAAHTDDGQIMWFWEIVNTAIHCWHCVFLDLSRVLFGAGSPRCQVIRPRAPMGVGSLDAWLAEPPSADNIFLHGAGTSGFPVSGIAIHTEEASPLGIPALCLGMRIPSFIWCASAAGSRWHAAICRGSCRPVPTGTRVCRGRFRHGIQKPVGTRGERIKVLGSVVVGFSADTFGLLRFLPRS